MPAVKIWMACAMLATFTGVGAVYTKPKAEQVDLSRTACGSVLDVGTDSENWKRLVFLPGDTCIGKFKCKVSLKKSIVTFSDTRICIDYSRMLLFGENTKIFIWQNEIKLLELLHAKRVLSKKENTLKRKCIKTSDTLMLEFTADCNKTLSEAFVGWMYAFAESTKSGSVYFVDGIAQHTFRMPKSKQARMTVRSHVWKAPMLETETKSSVEISFSGKSWSSTFCIAFNPMVNSAIPPGVTVKIFRAFAITNNAAALYLSLEEGESSHLWATTQKCYTVNAIQPVVILVQRRPGTFLSPSWKEEEPLFELTVGNGLNIMTTTRTVKTRTVETATAVTSADSEESEFGAAASIGVFFVFFAVLVCCCARCCHRFSQRRATSGDNANMDAESRPTSAETGPESHRMMPRIQPSAPSQWGREIGGNGTTYPSNIRNADPNGFANKDTEDPPPAYSDLFPS